MPLLCTQCSAGCGVLVKIMDGRAKKVEGNPLHPVSNGKLCVRGQAGLQSLYNPDRVQGPMKRKGARGENSFEPISWEEAITEISAKLNALKEKGETDKFYFLTSELNGHLGTVADNFMAGYGSSNTIKYDLFDHRNLRYANMASMGIEAIPHYDIENTQYLLSFGADFASTWLSPVSLSRGYGEMRQGGHSPRGKFVQVEPRLSLTAANADEWVPATPGSEAVLALAIAKGIKVTERILGQRPQFAENRLFDLAIDLNKCLRGAARRDPFEIQFGDVHAGLPKRHGGGADHARLVVVFDHDDVAGRIDLGGDIADPNNTRLDAPEQRSGNLHQLAILAMRAQGNQARKVSRFRSSRFNNFHTPLFCKGTSH